MTPNEIKSVRKEAIGVLWGILAVLAEPDHSTIARIAWVMAGLSMMGAIAYAWLSYDERK